MKVLTYTSYKERFKLYAEILDAIAVNSSQIELTRKDIILLSYTVVMLYRAFSRTGFEDGHIKLTLSAGTYSIDDFNSKVKVAVLQGRQDWEASQIKDLKLVFFFNWDSLHARLNSHYKALSYKKKKHKKIKAYTRTLLYGL